MIPDNGEIALIITADPQNPGEFLIHSTATLEPDNLTQLQHTYLSACTNLGSDAHTVAFAHTIVQPAFPTTRDSSHGSNFQPIFSVATSTTPTMRSPTSSIPPLAEVYAKKKYKPVAQKIRPVLGSLPDKFRIERHIYGNPLADMPALNPNPPPFESTGRYTTERRDALDLAHPGDFLWPAERALMHDFMRLQNGAFAWEDSERGRFRTDFFPPVDIPVLPHTPWVQRNIPIPPGIYDEVCRVIRTKIAAGVYEPSNSSYRSRWFCVVKKDGTSLRLVHALEPLNAVTVLVLPVSGSEPILNPNRTRTEPELRFGVWAMLAFSRTCSDMCEPVRT